MDLLFLTIQLRLEKIEVYISDGRIEVRDAALGISLKNIFTSLLVPTISTKTISIQQSNFSSSFEQKIVETTWLGKYHLFQVTVNGYAIIDIAIKKYGHAMIYAFNMPSSTPVPVSRDDFILSDPNYLLLFKEGISRLLYQAQEPIYLLRLLAQYQQHTSQDVVRMAVSEVILEDIIRSMASKSIILMKNLVSLLLFSWQVDKMAEFLSPLFKTYQLKIDKVMSSHNLKNLSMRKYFALKTHHG